MKANRRGGASKAARRSARADVSPRAAARRRCPDVNDSRDTSRPIVPTLHKRMARDGAFEEGASNLDLGGGKYDKATDFLAGLGVENLVVDPSRGDRHNRAVWREVRRRPVPTVTCANVLNVICSSADRQSVIKAAASALAEGGTAGFQVYVGDGSGVGARTKDGWQENRPPASYLGEIARWFDRVERKGNLFYASSPRRSPRGRVPPDGPVRGRAKAG